MRYGTEDVVMDVERCLVGQVKGCAEDRVVLERPSGARWTQRIASVRTASPEEAETLDVRGTVRALSQWCDGDAG